MFSEAARSTSDSRTEFCRLPQKVGVRSNDVWNFFPFLSDAPGPPATNITSPLFATESSNLKLTGGTSYRPYCNGEGRRMRDELPQ